VDISGQIVLGDESAALRGLVRDLLGAGYMLRRNLSRWSPRKNTSVLRRLSSRAKMLTMRPG